ncbi:phosphoglycerate dehydrogenase [[Ruminococcus] torques]|uniref:D-3-phosphoglycerate dehydrogenase n=1 Tax=[Ruminococcus] torques TaxID=33039 RepID=A0A4Q5CBE6_9FIRM|nr:phosphoglycerate dehydrogenase [[Ruminococcus] torques]MTQ68096.1 3-phosphoglycerate dehydrogenase [[Ruminococcus] torques]MTQ77187.1 3-phosphoglycerate dehydrogenase [[Ruminococcus] torques]MTQ83342.1 3-phosphoglycerate dehydrogenase [[Ruminococcus] torques]MTR57697.1 3-phosphoglycerate dehydrogenase [[Ruminococcus] torques]MTS74250.1 3-phosphoglycerate dehydrogenase [[Ruminococcus] torques]
MYKYHCLNPISAVGLDQLDENYVNVETAKGADAILVRSAKMHEMEFDKNLKVIARAGAGVNNIPLERCAEEGVVVFNTPGANANGVKELVIAGMLLAARDIIGGINWVQEYEEDGDIAKITEKKKKVFAGTELEGKKLGVIGLGAIGVLVANAAVHLGMEVYGYDPYVSVDSAWRLSRNIHHAKTADEIYKECDYITVHVPALEDTKGMINKDAISLMKKGVVILNFARDVLVNQEDIVDALVSEKVRCYVTDFPTKEIVGVRGAIVIPHLGASTEESEDNCAKMAAAEVKDFLENGNITHSVNFPDCDMGAKGEGERITILHKNTPNMIGQFTALLAEKNMNIEVMTNKSRKEYAYTMLDVDGTVSEDVEAQLAAVEGVLKVRVIR